MHAGPIQSYYIMHASHWQELEARGHDVRWLVSGEETAYADRIGLPQAQRIPYQACTLL